MIALILQFPVSESVLSLDSSDIQEIHNANKKNTESLVNAEKTALDDLSKSFQLLLQAQKDEKTAHGLASENTLLNQKIKDLLDRINVLQQDRGEKEVDLV